MQYQACRWYDLYPRLAFMLKLVQLMPAEQQAEIGRRLMLYLSQRTSGIAVESPLQGGGNRWYDAVPPFALGLAQLKGAPKVVKYQSCDFLWRLLAQPENLVRSA